MTKEEFEKGEDIAERRRWETALRDPSCWRPLSTDFADRVIAAMSGERHVGLHPFLSTNFLGHRIRRMPRWALLAASLVLMAGFVFAATVVVDTLMSGGSESLTQPEDEAVGLGILDAPKAAEGRDALAASSEAPFILSVPSNDNPPPSNNQLDREKGEIKMNIKQKVATAVAAIAMAVSSVTSFADTHVWKSSGRVNDWDWTNPGNFINDSAPSAGDTIIVPTGQVVRVNATDAASWAIACAPSTLVSLQNSGSFVEIEVGEGLDITNSASFQTAWDSACLSRMDTGGLRKLGKGKLTLASSRAEYAYYTKIDVQGGELMLSVGSGQSIGVLSVANGAVATISRQAISLRIAGLEGGGEIRREGSGQQMYLYGDGTHDFSGTLSENIYLWCANRQHLTGTASTMTNLLYSYSNRGKLLDGNYVGVSLFGTAGSPSSIGTAKKIVLGENGGGVRYLGLGETTVKNIELDTTIGGPSFIDGGTNGALVWNGNLCFSSWRGQAVSFVFTGENRIPCTFGGKLEDQAWTYRTAYITKEGTGTWVFTGTKTYTGDIGGIAVKNGILQFDSIAERGTDCALGKASKMTEDFSGTDSADAHSVPYAYVLGGRDSNGVARETALMEYTGLAAAHVTTRPAVINGRGGLKSSSAPFDFTGITSLANGENTLLLDGDGMVNTVRDVTNGVGIVGIEKNGTGTWIVAGTNDFSGPVTVNEGTLRIASTRLLHRWYRFNIKALQDSKDILVGYYFSLFDKDGRSLTDGFTNGASSATLAPGHVCYWGSNNDFIIDNASVFGEDLFKFFVYDGTCWGGYFMKNRNSWTTQKFDVDDESTWARILIRLPDNANPAASYDFLRDGGSEWRAKYQIKVWSLDASPDGQDWTEVSATMSNNVALSVWGKYWASNNALQDMSSQPAHTTGLSIASYKTIGTLPASREWSVAQDARLENEDDEPLVVNKLVVDARKGIGTFVNFKFAADGVVDIRNPTFGADGRISFTGDFSESEGFDNVSNWTFLVDGKMSRKYGVSVVGNTISLTCCGFTFSIR